MLTVERLREVLHYDPETGIFMWRVALGRRAKVGSRAGRVDAQGYRQVRIDNESYREHRLAWLYAFSMWPQDQLDHVNGAKADNRITNLRECTHSENQQNKGVNIRNTSGATGVSLHTRSGKWRAFLGRTYLGVFTSPEEAAEAYRIAKAKYHTFNPETRSTP